MSHFDINPHPVLRDVFFPPGIKTTAHGNTGQNRAAVATMAAAGQQQQNVDLSVLSLEQLNQMKTQHEEEVQTLSGNFTKLRDAQVMRKEGFISFFVVI